MPDAIVDPIHRRLPDGGPTYVETPPDLNNFPGQIAEPWNTASACLFVIIAVAWGWALRGRYRQYPFLTICLPILFAGGIGGVLFHGTRQSHAFFLLDVIPIFILGVAVAVWMWIRLGPKLFHLLGMIALLGLFQMLAFLQLPRQWAINLSYASLALIVMAPLAIVLIRTRLRHGGWIATSLACFAIAWIFRIADAYRPSMFPMGTHWLWHVFGALTTAALSVYVYRIERTSLRATMLTTPET